MEIVIAIALLGGLGLVFGLVLAAVLFMKRMSDVTSVRRWNPQNDMKYGKSIPDGTVVYEINGPMFFADADKFLDFSLEDNTKCVILRMSNVPSIDATAMKNIELLLTVCKSRNVTLLLSHVNPFPMTVIKKSGFYEKAGDACFVENIDVALKTAEEICK